MFRFNKTGDIVHVGQRVATFVASRGGSLEFLDYGGARQREKEWGHWATLAKAGGLVEPNGFSVVDGHGDVRGFTQDDAEPWHKARQASFSFKDKGVPMHTLECVGKIDAKDA
jgi:hypothetical protein